MHKKRILICSTLLSTINAFLILHIRLLQDMGYCVDVAGYKDTEALNGIVGTVYDIPYQRTPFSWKNIQASRRLTEICKVTHYDMVHFNTPVASAFGRWYIRGFRKNETKIFYTAHGFHFFKGAPIMNWLIYYPVEKFLAHYTDVIITINQQDYKRAKAFSSNHVAYIRGVGIDTEQYRKTLFDIASVRKELGISPDSFLILSVGELNRNKNHEVIVKAIAKINNSNIFYVICGQGSLNIYLKTLAERLGIGNQVILLGYRTDLLILYKVADAFAFPSRREGLGLAALEAMTSGLPIITSNIHGISDYSVNGETGFSCSPDDISGFSEAIRILASNPSLCKKFGKHNSEATYKFDVQNVLPRVKKIYELYLPKTPE